ncbi:hypothetical protein GCM10010191_14700 [Actinomadura vinacea]|uniref:Uncharacterized protein n=1 Tax=Actinomadura vinacea TaxID=115336 RepID=A0ABN3IM27_9ACTN
MPDWQRTGNTRFPVAARVNDQWWVLRINGFPDHPLWTLFVDGARCHDVHETSTLPGDPTDPSAPVLEPHTAQELLEPVQAFAVYGSEVGAPCDDPVCCG